LEIISTKAT